MVNGEEREGEEREKTCVCKFQIDWKIAVDRILPWIEKEIEKNGENEPVHTCVSDILDNFGITPRIRKNMDLKWFGVQFQRKLTEKGFLVQVDHNKEKIVILKKPENDKLFEKYEKEMANGMGYSFKVNNHLYNKKFGELADQVKKELEKSNEGKEGKGGKGGKVVVYMKEIRKLLGKQSEIVSDNNIFVHMKRVLKERNIFVGRMIEYDESGNDIGNIKLFTFKLKSEYIVTWKKRGFNSKQDYDEFREKYKDFDDKDFVNYL